MIQAIRQMLRTRRNPRIPAVPAGQRVYAVGDIHGRLDLFAALAEAIDEDDGRRGYADTTVVLLGDLIDRGPDSAGVLAAAREWQQRRRVRIITGNHEEMFLESLTNAERMRSFLRFGGRETILSYPVDAQAFHLAAPDEAQALMRAAVPAEDIAFIAGFEEQVAIGDYLFVHAGIRPGQPLDAQDLQDLRWIREPFLSHQGDHGMVVVHGHTISVEAQVQGNRIGIDTGAFMSGQLTALGLEGTERWLIEARESDAAVTVSIRAT